MTLAGSTLAAAESDLNCVSRALHTRCISSPLEKSNDRILLGTKWGLKPERGNGCVTIQRLGFERSKESFEMKSLFHSDIILTKQSISIALVALLLFLASLSRAADESVIPVNPNDEAGT
jgi:hypothetical protein